MLKLKDMKESVLFSLDGRTRLVDEILKSIESQPIEISLGQIRRQQFSDGEVCPDFQPSVRGKRVYLLTSANTAEKIMELNLAIDAAKRAAAKEIIPILPYFPYARQEFKC